MRGVYEAVEICENFYWVGAVDWELRDFHGYSTHRGTTYNSFLLRAGRTVLFDAVKKPFAGIMMERVRSVVDPASIDIVVSNHAEMDHSGGLPEIAAAVRPSRTYASRMGVKALAKQLDSPLEPTEVADGESVDIGGEQMLFLETRMLHWPDSMFTYLPSRGILVSQDAFGMHLATAELAAHRNPEALLREEAARYYANILMPYSGLVARLLARVGGMGLRLDVIAPDHGPVWIDGTGAGPSFILGLYDRWSRLEPGRSAVVVYDTMWQSTRMMAHAIAEGLSSGGVEPRVHPLSSSHRSDVAADLLEAGALLVGSPTLNGNLFPTVADVMAYLTGLRREHLVGAAFGSHGWSGEAVRMLSAGLQSMKVELVHPGLGVQYRPDQAELEACRALGGAAAAAVGGRRG